MSHLADALRRAGGRAAAADAFRDDDHPWGEALGLVADAPERAWPVEGGRGGDDDPDCGTVATHAPQPSEPVPVSEPASAPATAPRGAADAVARQQIAGLIERAFLPASGPAPRVVAFAGVDGDDSSSRIAAEAAVVLAQRTGARIGVVDLNFGHPSVHERFAIPNAPGLVEALGSDAPILRSARQVRGNLWVIPAGDSHAGMELPAGSRARLSHLTGAFDYVVMTLEPLADGFGAGFASLADGVVLVVSAETTRRDTARMVTERLQSSGAAILGAVLTDRRYPIPDAIYRRL